MPVRVAGAGDLSSRLVESEEWKRHVDDVDAVADSAREEDEPGRQRQRVRAPLSGASDADEDGNAMAR